MMPKEADFRDSEAFKKSEYGKFRNSLFAKSSQLTVAEIKRKNERAKAAREESEAIDSYNEAENLKNQKLALLTAENKDGLLEESESYGNKSSKSCCNTM